MGLKFIYAPLAKSLIYNSCKCLVQFVFTFDVIVGLLHVIYFEIIVNLEIRTNIGNTSMGLFGYRLLLKIENLLLKTL